MSHDVARRDRHWACESRSFPRHRGHEPRRVLSVFRVHREAQVARRERCCNGIFECCQEFAELTALLSHSESHRLLSAWRGRHAPSGGPSPTQRSPFSKDVITRKTFPSRRKGAAIRETNRQRRRTRRKARVMVRNSHHRDENVSSAGPRESFGNVRRSAPRAAKYRYPLRRKRIRCGPPARPDGALATDFGF